MRFIWSSARFRQFVVGPSEGKAVVPSRSIAKRVVFFLLALLLCSSVITVAQQPAPVTPTAAATKAAGAGYTGADAIYDIAAAVESNLNSMKSSSGLASLGMYLVGFFFFANFVWILVKGMMSGGGFLTGVIGDLVPLFVATGVAVLFLDRDVGALILSSLDTVAGAITGLGGAQNAGVASIIREAAIGTFSTLSNVWSVGGVTSGVTGIAGMLTALPSFLLALLAVFGTTFLIALALCVYMATLITSQVTAVIGLILAPLFVPFLMFKPASFMFDGWMRFILGAGMMKIVGLIMLQVTNVITATLAGISAKAAARANGALEALSVDMVLYAAMILLAALAAYLMAQVPAIATGLISGTGGGAGFSGWSNIASKSMATRGVMGDMRIGGGGGAGGKSQYAGQGITQAMPNSLKLASAGAGRATSSFLGAAVGMRDHRAARDNNTNRVARDTSRMSAGTEQAYTSYLERANANDVAKWGKTGHQGPPKPPVTLSRPKRSIDP